MSLCSRQCFVYFSSRYCKIHLRKGTRYGGPHGNTFIRLITLAVMLKIILFQDSNFSQALFCTPWWWITYNPKYVGVIFNFVSFKLLYNVDFNLFCIIECTSWLIKVTVHGENLKLLITLFNWVTNYRYWIVAEWNPRGRSRLVFWNGLLKTD